MIELRETYENDPTEFSVLEQLVKAAMFNSIPTVREATIELLKKRYRGIIKRGFVGDNQVMVEIQYKDSASKICYVCEIPVGYLGKPKKVNSFNID